MDDKQESKPTASLAATTYSGTEASLDFKDISCISEPNETFEIRRDVKFREPVTPVFDPQYGIVVGYKGRGTVWNVYDIEGNFLTMEELPLESPLIDPIDLIGAFGAKFIFRSAARAAATTAASAAIKGVGAGAAAALRRAVAKLVAGQGLKFTATTAQRMATSGRFVPLQILQLAIKYGSKGADPQKVKGAVMYTIKMSKYIGRAADGPIFKEYTLEVILREADNTILHFLYR